MMEMAVCNFSGLFIKDIVLPPCSLFPTLPILGKIKGPSKQPVERPTLGKIEACANSQHQLACSGCEPSGKWILQPLSSQQVTSALQLSSLPAETRPQTLWSRDKLITPCPKFLTHRHCDKINNFCFKPLCFQVICYASVAN